MPLRQQKSLPKCFVIKRITEMKVIAHTRYGVFESIQKDATKEEVEEMEDLLENLHITNWFALGTNKGKLYFTKEMIADTLFILEK